MERKPINSDEPEQLTRAAFEELFLRHSEELHGYAAGMVGSSEEARDVVHDVFERLWRRRRIWEKQGGSARAYLFSAVRRRALDKLERRRVRERHTDDEQHKRRALKSARLLQPGEAPRPDAYLEEQELHAALQSTLEALPPRQKEAFVLVNQRDLSYKEAAEVMGVSESTVGVHVHRALEALREAVGPLLPGRYRQ